MSFILEAQKRDAAALDPEAAAQLAIDEHRRDRWRWALWLIGIALLANFAILGYVFGPWSEGEKRSRGDQRLSSPSASRELVVRPRERTGPTNAAPERPRREPASRPRPSSNRTTTANAPTTASDTGSGKGRVLSPEEAAALNIALPKGEPEPATVSPDTAAVATGSETVIKPSGAPTSEVTETPPAATTASAGKTPITLNDLSAADRKDFPDLEFSTHVFADDPALRAVVVNSRRLSEGENIGEMVLRAVTEDGIIVDYRGQRVAVSVMDTWE